MKKRLIPFQQHLAHDIEDEDQAQDYLVESLLLVGQVVMYFNSLEQSLGSVICEIISDRTDSPGLIVLQNMSYAAKVDLFKRFSDDLHNSFQKPPPKYEGLIDSLLELGRLRNLVVHADWASTDHEGYLGVLREIADAHVFEHALA
jgi:hypothetical protein